METNSILIKNNATSRKKLQNLWQGTTGNYKSLNEIETISTGYNRTIRDLDRPRELEIFQETSQVKWMTGQMVFEAARLWLYSIAYFREDKHKDVQLLKEELWSRRTTAEVIMLKRTMTTNKTEILEEIKRNNTRGQEVIQALENKDRLSWEQDEIIYIEGRIYIPNNKKIMT